jgi:hypothetical protein
MVGPDRPKLEAWGRFFWLLWLLSPLKPLAADNLRSMFSSRQIYAFLEILVVFAVQKAVRFRETIERNGF